MRALFIYWKVTPERLPGALAAVRAFQAGLALSHPALHSHLYQRADAAAGIATLMETYAQPDGLDAVTELEIVERGRAVLADWCPGGRHVERFERLGP